MTMKHATVQPTHDGRAAVDVHARFAYRVGSATVPRTVGASSTTTVINDTSTPAMKGDFIRFASDAANPGMEIAIVEVSTNSFTLAAKLPVVPTTGDEFFIMRPITQRVDETGAQIVVLTLSPVTTVDFGSADAPITTGAWTDLVASLADDVTEIQIYNTTGKTMKLATGAASSEVQIAVIPPGVPFVLKYIASAGTRFSVQAVEGNATVGSICANFFGEV